MVDTLPDYASDYKSSLDKYFIDLSEVSARIGGINSVDRRGNVIWYDDFEAAILHWIEAGTNGDAAISTEEAYRGAQSCKLSVENIAEAKVYIDHPMEASNTPRCGVEVALAPPYWSGLFTIEISVYTGTTRYLGKIRYNKETGVWSYWSSAGAWVDLATEKHLSSYSHAWHHIKLVVNRETGYYERLIASETTTDLSTIAMQSSASTTATQTYIRLRLDKGSADDADYCYVDDVVYTINEPEND